MSRRHLFVLAGILAIGVLAVPGASWAAGRFDDVPDSNVFVADIEWLADAGITKGCNPPANTEFCPGSYVTREQMAAFMHRLAGGDNRTVDGRLDALEIENQKLKALLAGVSRNGDTLLFDGMNLQIVNGTGSTESSNSLGNVIIGYNEAASMLYKGYRAGSHYLVVGPGHTYTRYGGIVVGKSNSSLGIYASVTAGVTNDATGDYSSVSGGSVNTASGDSSSVSGGHRNTASGNSSSVSAGTSNTASNFYASVSGGYNNTASGNSSSVSGGLGNTASGGSSSVSGGTNNTTTGQYGSVVGGDNVYITSSNAMTAGEGFWNAVD